MKKLIICLFAIAFSFTSYAQLPKIDTVIYFKHSNINYEKIVNSEGSVTIQNIDAKYKGDKDEKIDYGTDWSESKQMDYGHLVHAKFEEDLHTLFFNYIKDHFTQTKKEELLNLAKEKEQNVFYRYKDPNFKGSRILALALTVERDVSIEKISWFCGKNEVQNIIKNVDIANLDMLVRENIVIEKNKLGVQVPFRFTASISSKRVIEFLENECKIE